MEDLEGAVSRQLLHLISWKDMSIDLIQPHVPNDQLALNLKRIEATLAAVVVPLVREHEVATLDGFIQVLVEPRLLHSSSKRLQGLVLACLQQALRIYRLEGRTREGATTPQSATRSEANSPPPSPTLDTNPAAVVPRASSRELSPRSSPTPPGGEIWLTAGGEMCALISTKDWSSTPFGPLVEWPHTLKIALAVCLFSRFPFVIYWGPEYRMLYNDAYRPIMGVVKHPRYLGDTYASCWPTMWEEQDRLLSTVAQTLRPNWVEDHYNPMDRNGYLEECYFTYSYSPLFLDDGSIGGLFTAVTETTLRVIGERQMRTLRDLSTRGVEAKTVKDALRIAKESMTTTGKYDIAFANVYVLNAQGRRAMLAETAGDLIRGSVLCPEVVTLPRIKRSDSSDDSKSEEDMDEEQGGVWCPIFNEVITTKEPQQVNLVPFGDHVPPCSAWGTTPDDRTRSCLVLPMVSHSGSEKVIGVLVAGVNPRHELDDTARIFFNLIANNLSSIITNATAREEERQRAEALAELDRAKTTFFSNISHEFRTPLTLMLGPLEDLLDQAELQIEKEQLTLIHRNALRLYKLVNSLLDFSRLEDGRAQANYEPVDLASFTQDLASIFRSAIERAGLELLVECEELEQPVYVDKDMWEKIVLNLLSNALKFTMHGHIHVAVKSVLGATGQEAELMVADTGIGIPKEELPLLGKRFHRVQTPGGRSHEGTGIGLALVFELVRLHGGTVQVSSQLGHGATFRVHIPFGAGHLPVDQTKRMAAGALVSATAAPRGQLPLASSSLLSEPATLTLHDDANLLTSPLADARNYSKMASWWLPSVAIATSSSSGSHHSSQDSASSSSSSSSSPSHSVTWLSGSPTSGGSPEMPSSPRSRTAASFSVATTNTNRSRKPRRRHMRNKDKAKAKILLVDDNSDMREYVARLLSAKYEVISVSNGLEALNMLQPPETVDLVLTDVMMPFLDGFGLLKQLRAREETRTLPVIMLSARAGEEASAEGLAEGADDYLTKPFTARELLSRVASHLNMSRMRSEAVRTEHVLRMEVHEGKERLEHILASIQDAFVSLDSSLRFLFVNVNAAILFGAKKEDMLGHKVSRYILDTDDGLVTRKLEQAVRDKVDLAFDFHYAPRDRWFEVRIFPGADGGVSIFTIDVTPRKKAEGRLALLAKVGRMLMASVESHLPSLLKSALTVVEGSVVADWSILDVVTENGSLHRFATSNAPTHLWKIHKLDNDDGEPLSDRYYQVLRVSNGERIGIESDLPATYSIVLHELHGHGRVYGTWLFVRHNTFLSEDKAVCAELALRAGMAIDNVRLYREAENANKAKDHFLAALSHELRTPLTPALLLSESLLSEGLSSQVKENVRLIHESVELEVQLIDDLLDLTKISRNKLKLDLQDVAVHDIVARTLQIVTHEAKTKRITVACDFGATADRLIGDPARLQQVVWNLAKNAIKFTPEGGAITIRTSNYVLDHPHSGDEASTAARNATSPVTDPRNVDNHERAATRSSSSQTAEAHVHTEQEPVVMLRLEIADTGIGIESHVIPHLFRAFEQGDASITVRFGGLGLGLAISRSLVEMHRGKLEAASEGKNKGATFVVHLPVDAQQEKKPTVAEGPLPAAPPMGEPQTLPSTSSTLGAPRSLKVLLVEDNKSTLMIMSRLLRQKLNYSVLVASSVADALRVADEENGQFDLVISDIGLPDGSGLDLMAALKAKYNLHGIALSGYGMEEDVKRSKDAGFALHLTKPVHFAALSSAIHTLFPATAAITVASSSS